MGGLTRQPKEEITNFVGRSQKNKTEKNKTIIFIWTNDTKTIDIFDGILDNEAMLLHVCFFLFLLLGKPN